jgi:hypothetical protein
MTNGKFKVVFDHVNQRATMSIVDSGDNVLIDFRGDELSGMRFPYSHLKEYKELFEKIEDDGKTGRYYFPKDI